MSISIASGLFSAMDKPQLSTVRKDFENWENGTSVNLEGMAGNILKIASAGLENSEEIRLLKAVFDNEIAKRYFA